VIRNSLISLLLLCSVAHGIETEWNGQVTVGAKYNSNVEYLYLVDRLSDDEQPRKEAFFALLNGDVSLSIGEEYLGKIAYSLLSESGLDRPELSRFDQYLAGSFSHLFGEDLLLDCSLVLHHAAERWPVPRQLSIDLFGWVTVLYDLNEHFSPYGSARFGYYHDIDPFGDRRLDYFRGPAGGVEGGWYIYPAADTSYLKTGVGVDLNWLRDEEYDRFTDRTGDVLGVSNKHLRITALVEGAFVDERVTAAVALRYVYQYWLGVDMFRYLDWEKRRIEHTVHLQPEIEYRFLEHYAVRVTGSVMRKLSNIGEHRDDYTDYSFLQFTGAASFSYTF